MKHNKLWSYRPYKPLFFETGDIYICRVAPTPNSIHFEWLPLVDNAVYSVFCKNQQDDGFTLMGKTRDTQYTINALTGETEWEFFVESEGKKSRIRLARTGECLGQTVINYLHPQDDAYSFSGNYLCSPSIVRLPNGDLLSSMDVFCGCAPQNLTLIFRSTDNGESWHYVNELFPCFWGKLFVHKNELYMLACSTEYGDLLIGKSTDNGNSFCEPTVLFRGGGGKDGEPGIHKNPMPLTEYNGRLWGTLEWGAWSRNYHAVMVMSAPLDSDLLDSDSWTFSEPTAYSPAEWGLPEGKSCGNIEGNIVIAPDGCLYNIMRYDMRRLSPNYGLITAYKVNTDCPDAPLTFDRAISFPANHSKFVIRYDAQSGKYYTIASRILDSEHSGARNLLSLMSSTDLDNWTLVCDIYDKTDCDIKKVGFQYVDFFIEGDSILLQCRTSMNNAHSFHDSNYAMFDVLKNFRER